MGGSGQSSQELQPLLLGPGGRLLFPLLPKRLPSLPTHQGEPWPISLGMPCLPLGGPPQPERRVSFGSYTIPASCPPLCGTGQREVPRPGCSGHPRSSDPTLDTESGSSCHSPRTSWPPSRSSLRGPRTWGPGGEVSLTVCSMLVACLERDLWISKPRHDHAVLWMAPRTHSLTGMARGPCSPLGRCSETHCQGSLRTTLL